MKQALYLLLALACYCTNGYADKTIQMNDVQKMGLKGKVKSYAQYEVKTINDTLVKDYLKRLTLFDEKGNKTESNTFNRNHETTGRTKSKVGPKGKVLEEKTYNKNGEETAKTDNAYDKKGRLVRSVKFGKQGDTLSTWAFTYDKKGRKQTSEYKDKEKTLNATYTYDKKGNVSEMTIYKNQVLSKKEDFTYDKDGRLTAWAKSNGKDTTHTTETKYNAWGMQTGKRVYLNGTLQELFIYENDNRGNKTATYHYNGNKEKTEALIDIEYSNYDQYDNKTLRHKIKGGVTVEGEINEYTYY